MKIPNKIKTLCSVVALTAVTGCVDEYSEPEKVHLVEIEGIPLGVSFSQKSYHYHSHFGTVIDTGEGIVYASGSGMNNYNGTKAKCLIESEMNDGDNEKISITVGITGDVATIYSLTANSKEVKFR